MNQEIADNSRACCNCANATMSYPNCSCWQHKYCNGDKPYIIPKEAWIKTAEECEEFELGTPEEADIYLELHRIMSEESKDKNPKQEQPKPTCKTCGFYENNCPFIRGKLIPYPNKVCKDYIHSAMKEQQPAEWSEEDEKMRDRILEILNKYGNIPVSGGKVQLRFNKEYMWLKHLYERFNPQPHWKPSEEQITALKVVARGFPTDDPDVIDSLLHDLKKLM